MNKTRRLSCVGQSSYAVPKCYILELKTEGILCYSSWAEKILKDDELTDFEQIF